MNLQDLRLLVDFHYWARDRVLDAVGGLTAEQWNRDLGSSFKSVRETVQHLYLAEWIWYSRWQGESPATWPPTDHLRDLSALRAVWSGHEAKVRAFVDGIGEEGAQRMFDYKLMSGQPGRSSFIDSPAPRQPRTYTAGRHTMLRQSAAPEERRSITYFASRRPDHLTNRRHRARRKARFRCRRSVWLLRAPVSVVFPPAAAQARP